MKKVMKTLLAVIMIACFAVMSTACINSNWRRVDDKLEKEGYEVEKTTNENYIKGYLEEFEIHIEADEVECAMAAYKGDKFIYILFCESFSAARDAKKDAKDFLELLIEANSSEYEDYKVGRDGKVVYLGHKDAIKAAK